MFSVNSGILLVLYKSDPMFSAKRRCPCLLSVCKDPSASVWLLFCEKGVYFLEKGVCLFGIPIVEIRRARYYSVNSASKVATWWKSCKLGGQDSVNSGNKVAR